MTDEEKAEEYVMREDIDTMKYSECYNERVFFEKEVKQAYLDGLAEGRKEKECNCMTYLSFKDLEKENAELKKELDCYKALDSHYDEIEEDAKRIAEENEQLKKDKELLDNTNNEQTEVILELQEHIREVENDSNNCELWSYIRITEFEKQIEKMKCCENCKKHRNAKCTEDEKFYARTTKHCDNWELAE